MRAVFEWAYVTGAGRGDYTTHGMIKEIMDIVVDLRERAHARHCAAEHPPGLEVSPAEFHDSLPDGGLMKYDAAKGEFYYVNTAESKIVWKGSLSSSMPLAHSLQAHEAGTGPGPHEAGRDVRRESVLSTQRTQKGRRCSWGLNLGLAPGARRFSDGAWARGGVRLDLDEEAGGGGVQAGASRAIARTKTLL